MMAKLLSSSAPAPPDAINAIHKANAIQSVVLARAEAGDYDGARKTLGLIPAGRYADARARALVEVLARRGDLAAARAIADAIRTEDHRELACRSMVEAYARAGDLRAARALADRIRRVDNRLVAKMHLAATADHEAILRAAAAEPRVRAKTFRALARLAARTPSRSSLPKWIAALPRPGFRYYAFLGAAEGIIGELPTDSARRKATPANEVTTWGKESNGLRCRARCPRKIEQGMPLAATVEFQAVPDKLAPGVKQLNTFLYPAFFTLRLTNVKTGKSFAARPHDPTSGMPALDRGETTLPLGRARLKPLEVSFPLVRIQKGGKNLDPDAYEGVVTFSFPRKKTQWWRKSEEEWLAGGFWSGTVSSPRFRLEVLKETPKTRRLLLPKRLRVGKDLSITFSKEDAEATDLPVRNGYVLWTRVNRDGQLDSLRGGVPRPDDVNAIDQWYDYKGGDRNVSYTIEVFETADPPMHMWHPGPGSGGYKVLWKRTFNVRYSEAKPKAPAADPPGKAEPAAKPSLGVPTSSQVLGEAFARLLADFVVAQKKATGKMPEGATKPGFLPKFFEAFKKQFPRLLQTRPEEEKQFEAGRFDDAGNRRRLSAALKKLERRRIELPAISRFVVQRSRAGALKGAELEFATRLLEAHVAKAEAEVPGP